MPLAARSMTAPHDLRDRYALPSLVRYFETQDSRRRHIFPQHHDGTEAHHFRSGPRPETQNIGQWAESGREKDRDSSEPEESTNRVRSHLSHPIIKRQSHIRSPLDGRTQQVAVPDRRRAEGPILAWATKRPSAWS